jgi:uncharacterized protein (TIGR02466 family)
MIPEIYGIFPEPVYKVKLKRNFSEKEMLFVNEQRSKTIKNDYNLTSIDNYILKNNELNTLHDDLIKIVKDYFIKIIETKNNITPYITQSWLNYTNKGEKHHSHTHPNSLVSGVLYINANKNLDSIKFERKKHNQIELETLNYNLFNAITWSFEVESLDVILFPSHLTHRVDIKEGDNQRISLAFNVFVKGKIGDNLTLTELYI